MLLPKMNIPATLILLTSLMIAVIVSGCELSAEEEKPFQVINAVSSEGVDEEYMPVNATDTFYPDTPEIFVVTEVEGGQEGMGFTASWIWETEEDYHIQDTQVELPRGASKPYFSMTCPDEGWPAGRYRVELNTEEKLAATVNFQVIEREESLEEEEEETHAAAPPGMEIFTDREMGFAIPYPEHWVYERPQENLVIFSGPEGTDEYYTTINVQNLLSTRQGGIYSDVESIYQDYKEQFEEAEGEVVHKEIELTGETPFMNLLSYYFLEGEEFWQWMIVVQRDEDIFHQLTYTAPEDLFDNYKDLAEEMMFKMELID